MNGIEIARRVRRVNEREAALNQIKGRFSQVANDFLCEAILQGRDLLELKAIQKPGEWSDFLASSFPDISQRRAQAYMQVASKAETIPQLDQCGSLREALRLCAPPEISDNEPKRWVPFVAGIERFSKACGFVQQHPINEWPSEGIDRLREKLQPIVQQLWPDKFSA